MLAAEGTARAKAILMLVRQNQKNVGEAASKTDRTKPQRGRTTERLTTELLEVPGCVRNILDSAPCGLHSKMWRWCQTSFLIEESGAQREEVTCPVPQLADVRAALDPWAWSVPYCSRSQKKGPRELQHHVRAGGSLPPLRMHPSGILLNREWAVALGDRSSKGYF